MNPEQAQLALTAMKKTPVARGLVHAVTHGSVELVQLYLDAGVDPNTPNQEEERPLEVAVLKQRTAIARILLHSGARTDIPLLLFQAVYEAAFTDDVSMIELIAGAGASLEDIDEETGFDALALARDMANPTVVKVVERLNGF